MKPKSGPPGPQMLVWVCSEVNHPPCFQRVQDTGNKMVRAGRVCYEHIRENIERPGKS